MKKLILIPFLFLACKKETPQQTPEPEPLPTCQTGKVTLVGKYRLLGIDAQNVVNGDTITIVFRNNRCPETDKNDYIVYGLKKALSRFYKSGTLPSDTLPVRSTAEGPTSKFLPIDTNAVSFQASFRAENLQFYSFKGFKLTGSSLDFYKNLK